MESVLAPEFAGELSTLVRRVAALEIAAGVRRYTTAGRPPAAPHVGDIIFNTSTLKHEGSNGTTWNALY